MTPLPEDLEPTKLYWKVPSEPKIEADQCSLGLLGIPFVEINFSAVQDLVSIQKAIPSIFKVQLDRVCLSISSCLSTFHNHFSSIVRDNS